MDSQGKNSNGIRPAHYTNFMAALKQPNFPELTDLIYKMMFVSGETAEASAETTSMIEEIVHTQVVEMVSPRNLNRKKLYINLTSIYSLSDRPHLQPDVDRAPSQQMIFSS